jgi:DNA (cytosine-5)-methyltransferase 1
LTSRSLSASRQGDKVRRFLVQRRPKKGALTAISLFSGAGLSDTGYAAAGFEFVVQVELESRRAECGQDNFPRSKWLIGDVGALAKEVVATYRRRTTRPLDLCVLTPPCQGMSSSNPSRGKRRCGQPNPNDEKNRLALDAIPILRALSPRVMVMENVRQILTATTHRGKKLERVLDWMRRDLPDYAFYETVINVADYGIPQDRRRAVVVGVRRDQPWLAQLEAKRRAPWPAASHAEDPSDGLLPWKTARQWFEAIGYERLSAKNAAAARGKQPLHRVPFYGPERFGLLADIPPYTGQSAYSNSRCPSCDYSPVAGGRAICSACGGVMTNRPVVVKDGVARLVRGFLSSYRRMYADRPAATITTNSSHIGSDYKIHPWEPRVLSALECADLQTVPHWYRWGASVDDGEVYQIRNLVGEAFPAFFTYLHGHLLAKLLAGSPQAWVRCSALPPEMEHKRRLQEVKRVVGQVMAAN